MTQIEVEVLENWLLKCEKDVTAFNVNLTRLRSFVNSMQWPDKIKSPIHIKSSEKLSKKMRAEYYWVRDLSLQEIRLFLRTPISRVDECIEVVRSKIDATRYWCLEAETLSRVFSSVWNCIAAVNIVLGIEPQNVQYKDFQVEEIEQIRQSRKAMNLHMLGSILHF
jgi:hypothetical protein